LKITVWLGVNYLLTYKQRSGPLIWGPFESLVLMTLSEFDYEISKIVQLCLCFIVRS